MVIIDNRIKYLINNTQHCAIHFLNHVHYVTAGQTHVELKFEDILIEGMRFKMSEQDYHNVGPPEKIVTGMIGDPYSSI